MSLLKSTDKLVEGLNNKFFTEERAQQALQTEIDGLQSGINNEQSARQAADSGFDGRLNVIEGSGVGSINKAKQDAKDYADQKVADLINGAPAMLDTLKEIADQLGNDESAVSALTSTVAANLQTAKDYADGKVSQEVSDRQAAVSSEASARQSADSALSTRVGVLEQDPTTKTYVDGQISSEQTARQNAVSAEQTRAQGAESALSGRIGSLELDSVTKTYVDGQVSSEQTARQNADTALGGRLDILEGSGAGSVLKAKQDAQSYADQKISDLINGAPGTLDTLKEIADQLASDESVVGALTSTVTSNLQAAKDYADGKVNTEQSRAQAAEAGISSNLSSEISRAQSAESSLNLAISQEVSDRQAAVSAEASARAAEDLTMVKLDGSRIMTGTLKVPTIQGSANEWGGRLFLSSTENGGKSAVQINDGSGFAITTPGLDSTLTSQYYLNGNPTAQVGLLLASEAGKDWDNNAWNFFVGRYGDGAYMAMGGSAGGSLADIRPLNAGETSSTIFFRTVDESGDPGSVGAAKIQIKASENHGNGHFGSYYNFQARKQGASQVNALDVRAEYMQMYGGMVVAQKSVSSDYSVVIGDYLIGVSDLSVTKNITLPDPSEVPAGMTFVIKDMTGSASQTNYINIIPSAGKIDGQNAFALKAAYESVMIISDGTNYYVL